jgi:cell division septum initiation protein DivIVA
MPREGSRGDLVISMTLAETFLLLVFMVWYSVRPKIPAEPPTSVEVLKKENQDLKQRIYALETELTDIQQRLEWWRKRFDQPVPGSEEELKKLMFEAGRGKPKCQEQNVLLDVSLINGTATAKVLVDSPALRGSLLAQHIDIHAGAIVSKASEIDAVLREVRAFRKVPGQDGDCRFDYHFTYATFEDYYTGRERFEKYFYSAGRQRLAQAPQR